MRFFPAILIIMLAACQPAAPVLTSAPTPVSLTGSVAIDTPVEGAIIYSEVLAISGTATGLPGDSFVIALTGPDGSEIARRTIRHASGAWSLELLHGYDGEPEEVTLAAYSIDPNIEAAYALRTIGLAALRYRPEGVFGSIDFPADSDPVGGESVLVTGRASGVPAYDLSIDMVDENGTVIAQTSAVTNNPYLIDELPWTADLPTQGHYGAATIQLSALDEVTGDITVLDSVDVRVDTPAG